MVAAVLTSTQTLAVGIGLAVGLIAFLPSMIVSRRLKQIGSWVSRHAPAAVFISVAFGFFWLMAAIGVFDQIASNALLEFALPAIFSFLTAHLVYACREQKGRHLS